MQSQNLSLDGIPKAQFERRSEIGRNRTVIRTQSTTIVKAAHFPVRPSLRQGTCFPASDRNPAPWVNTYRFWGSGGARINTLPRLSAYAKARNLRQKSLNGPMYR